MAAVTRVAGLVAKWSQRAAQSRALSAAAGQSPIDATTAPKAPAGAPQTLGDLSDAQLLSLLASNTISPHKLESDIGDATRAVHIRRLFTAAQISSAAAPVTQDPLRAFGSLPMAGFDTNAFYKSILNTNCEAVIGYVPLPVGVVGPLVIDGREYRVPMATTEGALIASTNRGCSAIRKAGGATTVITGDGMTRAPLVRVSNLAEAAAVKAWIERPENFEKLAAAFASTTRFGRLRQLSVATAGRNVYLRFKCTTGDAMGMNMITKGVNEALQALKGHFPSMRVLSLSGNFCTDKKPSAVNWIEGRGKSVSAEVRLSGHVLKTVLKTSAEAMVELNQAKNLVGSALAGSVGGFNAHASNIVTAVFLATGQDAAQNVESSTCLTLMELDHGIIDPADPERKAGAGVVMSVTMPSVEVGTIGGGTTLPAQAACLELLGLKGSSSTAPGSHAQQLARVVAGTVLAGELSLMSALTTNDLLSSHMKLNRKPSAAMLAATEAAHAAGHAGALITPQVLQKLREVDASGSSSSASSGSSGSHGHGHGGKHHAHAPAHLAHVAPGGGAPTGAVPGGAPAGAHPHPLHLTGHAGSSALFSAAQSPGRRYFAAPTSHVHRLGQPTAVSTLPTPSTSSALGLGLPGHALSPLGLGLQAAAGAGAEAEAADPCLPVP